MKEGQQRPYRWYEGQILTTLVALNVGEIILIGWISNGLTPDIKLSAASAVIYLLGTLMDIKSSVSISKIEEKYDVQFKELSPLMKKFPSSKEFHKLASLKGFADVSLAALSPIFPPLGIATGVKRGLAALNNARVRDRFLDQSRK